MGSRLSRRPRPPTGNRRPPLHPYQTERLVRILANHNDEHSRQMTTAHTVIIGGGIMGAATAFQLAKRGCADVIVLEAGEMFGMESTGLNAGGVRHQFASPVNIELSKISFGMMERFADEMDQQIGLRRCGYLFMVDEPDDLEQFRRNVAVQNRHGVPSCVVTTEEIEALAPEVD